MLDCNSPARRSLLQWKLAVVSVFPTVTFVHKMQWMLHSAARLGKTRAFQPWLDPVCSPCLRPYCLPHEPVPNHIIIRGSSGTMEMVLSWPSLASHGSHLGRWNKKIVCSITFTCPPTLRSDRPTVQSRAYWDHAFTGTSM